jgi:methylenetetrahydrofolate--tRNA-(uracil-5-)-methyltransferase
MSWWQTMMMTKPSPIIVVGSGLAGSQAALVIARLGGSVELFEMRPRVRTVAHRTPYAAELVCSNSFRSNEVCSAAGLLKQELRLLGCELIRMADDVAIPGGTSLTVDRERFSRRVTVALRAHPRIRLRTKEITAIPAERISVLATGPLTSDALAGAIQHLTGESNLAFHDAIAPVVDADTIDMGKVFAASRYGKAGADFLNCPLDRQQYGAFRNALLSAEGIFKHQFDELNFFGCPPIEELARRGEHTLRYGPMKPVGLCDPRTGRVPYAVVQLRRENLRSDSYNMVAFQNQLKFGEQQRVFRLIPGLERVEFMRFGQMHRNTYVCAPALLNVDLSLRRYPDLFLAGQLCGVEGYVEAIATGLIAGTNAWRRSCGLPLIAIPRACALGSITHYLANADAEEFAPLRFTFDLLPPCDSDGNSPGRRWHREHRRRYQCQRALEAVRHILQDTHVVTSRSAAALEL